MVYCLLCAAVIIVLLCVKIYLLKMSAREISAQFADRLKNDTVSTMVMYGKGKIKTLIVFPSIFKGEHVSHSEMVKIMSGREVTVKFDRPTALQIDGETILGVTEYTVRSKAAGK